MLPYLTASQHPKPQLGHVCDVGEKINIVCLGKEARALCGMVKGASGDSPDRRQICQSHVEFCISTTVTMQR